MVFHAVGVGFVALAALIAIAFSSASWGDFLWKLAATAALLYLLGVNV